MKKIDSATVKEILLSSRTVAVVGLSPDPARPSYQVAEYLRRAGYRIIPVNPSFKEILGEQCYPTLNDIPDFIDIVDIFRRSEFVPSIVEEAIGKGARVVWMQEGVINETAACRAEQAGLKVIMDRCMLKEHRFIVRS